MNAELQKLRRHYESLLPSYQGRPTAQCLLEAIQIAEAHERIAETAECLYSEIRGRFGSVEDMGNDLRNVMTPLKDALARVTKER